ncbi:LysR substrate-binding domain-containing protein [Szabonella alba]|uniref:LysR family transcriptional regulator n=1 Tax=Szabonella alba TaxID=2804194 RepID=A0A8K0VGY1_9RHOB|nr:LysR substrate-binding domain-containing protein [Szabonella alba]MBL4919242.1 LysR family transcriptional regulator [Szabonella alba]
MTLDQLRIFLAVARRGNMTRAAQDLRMTQSAVSASVAALETQHQVRLFDRIGRGIALTPEGRAFIPAAEAVLARAGTAQVLLEDLRQDTRGLLRLHASQTVASYWLPPHLVRLNELHPGITIALAVGNTEQVARAVQEGEADLGFVEGDVRHSGLRRQVVARDELVLVLAADHPLATQKFLDAGDYRRLAWVLREQGSGTRAEFESHLQTMGLTLADLDLAFECPSNEALLAAVGAGRMAAMLSRRAVGAHPGIAARTVDWAPAPRRPFAALTHPDRHRTRAVTALLALVSA